MSAAVAGAATAAFRPCVLVPTFDNPATIAGVVDAARSFVDDVVVVDDGSGPAGREAVGALAARAHVRRRERNGGKGAAVKTGIAFARELGFTHALQVDADGQHDVARIPAFLEAAERRPDAAIFAFPEYGADAPRGRRFARRITQFWVNLETGGRRITDPMVGFRVYPLASMDVAARCGDRMDFDIEVAVRLVWSGVEIVNLPVGVRYLSAEDGGVSHFRLVRDNLRISWLHTRLTTIAILRALRRGAARLFGRGR